MPQPPIPSEFDVLLASKALAHLATIDADGKPNVNPVWFLWDGTSVLLSVLEETGKYRNLRANPRVALSISNPDEPMRYLEIRGEVTAFELYEDLTFVNQLALKFTGTEYTRGQAGQRRYKLTIHVDRWTGYA
jgi:PPOX class probable F420-dependent enzyme